MTFTESAARARVAVDPHRLLGPVPCVRARRPRPSCACTSGRRAPRRRPRPDAPPDVVGVLFFALRDVRRRRLALLEDPGAVPRHRRSACREGGIGWVAGLLDRLDHMLQLPGDVRHMDGIDLTPAEVMQRNFWFCAVEDPSAFELRDRIGVDHILRRGRLPALRLDVAQHPDECSPRRSATCRRKTSGRSRGRTPPACTVTPCPKL